MIGNGWLQSTIGNGRLEEADTVFGDFRLPCCSDNFALKSWDGQKTQTDLHALVPCKSERVEPSNVSSKFCRNENFLGQTKTDKSHIEKWTKSSEGSSSSNAAFYQHKRPT